MLPPRSLPMPSGEPPAAMIAASPPRRATARPRQVPGIVRPAINRIVRLMPDHELRQIRLAQHDGPARRSRATEMPSLSIGRRYCGAVQADRRRRSRQMEAFFERDRHTLQRTALAASLPHLGATAGLPSGLPAAKAPGPLRPLRRDRLVESWHDDGIEPRIDLLNPVDEGPRDFDGRNFALAILRAISLADQWIGLGRPSSCTVTRPI